METSDGSQGGKGSEENDREAREKVAIAQRLQRLLDAEREGGCLVAKVCLHLRSVALSASAPPPSAPAIFLALLLSPVQYSSSLMI